MTLAHFFDHVVSIWRAAQSRSGTLRIGLDTWTAVVSGTTGVSNARFQPESERVVDLGGGQMVGGFWRFYMDDGTDVAEQDIVLVEEGPMAGAMYEVQEVRRYQKPKVEHHVRIKAIEWRGEVS
jgi:hypothetical protein